MLPLKRSRCRHRLEAYAVACACADALVHAHMVLVVFATHFRAARLTAAEEEKSVLLARAEAAERVLVKGESKDQARMDALSDETRASRLKFLALSERLRQMTRLRDQASCTAPHMRVGLALRFSRRLQLQAIWFDRCRSFATEFPWLTIEIDTPNRTRS